jgi:hypothetical protein
VWKTKFYTYIKEKRENNVGINRIKACSLLPESSLITLCILVRVGMKYMFKCIGPRRTLEELKAFN